MRPPSRSKLLTAALILISLTGFTAAADSTEPVIDSPHCSSELLDQFSAACQGSPFQHSDLTEYDDPVTGSQDDVADARQSWYSEIYYMPSQLHGLAGGTAKIRAIEAINDGQSRAQFDGTAEDLTAELYSEQLRRLAAWNRYTVDRARALYQENKTRFPVQWCTGTPDELELTTGDTQLSLPDGTTTTVRNLLLMDQNQSTAGSCADGTTQDRTQPILVNGLGQALQDLNVTVNGSEKVLVNAEMQVGLHDRLDTNYQDDRNQLEVRLDDLFQEVTAGEHEVADLDPWAALVSAADRYAATESYEARSLPTQGLRAETQPGVVATVEVGNETYTGQLFGGRDAATYEVNTSYSPGLANIVTSNATVFIGSGYTVTELVDKSSGAAVTNMTAELDLYNYEVTDLGSQIAATQDLHDMAIGSQLLGGIGGRIVSSGSTLLTAIWDLIYQSVFAPILGVFGL